MMNALPSTLLAVLCAWLALLPLAHGTASYFFITNPQSGTTWVNGQNNVVTWEKGLLDDVDYFDIELSRLSVDGLTYVARDVASQTKGRALNIALSNVPAGDDYFLIFLNVTHGTTYCVSDRFSIAAAGSPGSNTPAPSPSATVVTVTGSPDPTLAFFTTFPASANAALPTWAYAGAHFAALSAVLALALGAGAWAVW